MSFIWTRKIAKPQVVTSAEVSAVVEVQTVEIPAAPATWAVPASEVKDASESDKISGIEHKNGECLASSRKEDDAFGGGEEEVDGQEVVLPRAEDGEVVVQEGTLDGEEDSSPFASLKK